MPWSEVALGWAWTGLGMGRSRHGLSCVCAGPSMGWPGCALGMDLAGYGTDWSLSDLGILSVDLGWAGHGLGNAWAGHILGIGLAGLHSLRSMWVGYGLLCAYAAVDSMIKHGDAEQ
jgi:hypothetical protein